MSCKNKTQIPTRQTKSYIGYYKLSNREFGTAIPNKEKRKGKKDPFFPYNAALLPLSANTLSSVPI